VSSRHVRPLVIRTGFSLIEMLVVITIVGLLAGMAMLKWSGTISKMQFGNDLAGIASFDRRARNLAIQRNESLRLIVDLDNNAFMCQHRKIAQSVTTTFGLSNASQIENVATIDGQAVGGQIEVYLSESGTSASYAVLISNEKRKRWLLFVGGTGQVFSGKSDEEIQAYFQQLQLEGVNAG
jgi:prepilin-type N-terminal cleavage/methylation domain-containing protein